MATNAAKVLRSMLGLALILGVGISVTARDRAKSTPAPAGLAAGCGAPPPVRHRPVEGCFEMPIASAGVAP